MITLKIKPKQVSLKEIKAIAKALLSSQVIAYPTDTVYGLGCLATNSRAIDKIRKIKGRNRTKAMIILVDGLKMLEKYCLVDSKQKKLLKLIWPGPFSVILPSRHNLPQVLSARQKTLAVRCPQNDFLLKLIKEIKVPLVSTSLNLSGGEVLSEVKNLAKHFGGCADPFAAFLLERSLKTFELRVNRQNNNAIALAKALSKHKNVLRVIYPGLPTHPQYKLARKQMSNFGGMLTVEVKGGAKGVVKVCDNLRVAINAMSLGGVETLVSIPIYSSHVNMSKSELAQHGVTPGMIRISTGVEGIEDLVKDFYQALSKI